MARRPLILGQLSDWILQETTAVAMASDWLITNLGN